MRRVTVIVALCALVVGAAAGAAPTPSFTDPVRLGFPKGDDWEPALAADRLGHVYALWTHYTSFAGQVTGEPDPTCPQCANPHMDFQV